MMLSVMVVGAGAAFSDQSKIKNTEAVDACTALNIIGGYPDGSFKPEGNITRAEVTKMICVALNGGKNPAVSTNTTPTFSDVRNNANAAWAEGYIESCAAQGIVSGVGGGKFAPNGNVTGVQLAKMLLVSLGYKSENEGFTGNAWATNVNVRAAQKGLYEGLEKMDTNAAITRDNAAQMVWNALNAYEVEYKTDLIAGADGKLSTQITVQDKMSALKEKITLLEDKYEAVTKKGILSAVNYDDNDKTYTTKVTGVTDGQNGIGNIDAAVDYSSLMGQQVKVMYTVDNKSKDVTLLGIYATDKNKTVTALYDDAKINGNTATIDGEDYDITGITTIATNGTVIKAADYDSWTHYPYAQVTLVDNDNDKVYEYAVVNPFKVAQLTSLTAKKAYFESTTDKSTKSMDRDDLVGYDKMAEDDYVMLTEKEYTVSGDYVAVKAATVSGKVTGIKNTDTIKMDGNWYKKAPTLNSATITAPASGDDLDYAVVANGFYFATEGASSSTDKMALVLKVGDQDFDGDYANVKLLLSDGTTKTTKAYYKNSDNKKVPPVVGTLYTYTENSNGYVLKTIATGKDIGLDATAISNATYNSKTNKVSKNETNTRVAADAQVFVLYEKTGSDSNTTYKGKLVTGADADKWAETNSQNQAQNYRTTVAYTDNDGKVVKVMVVDQSASDVPNISDDSLYGVILSEPYSDKNADDEDIIVIDKFLTEKGVVTDLKIDTEDFDMSQLKKNMLVSYEMDGSDYVNFAKAPTGATAVTGAVTDVDSKYVTIKTTSNFKDLKIDKDDSHILYADTDALDAATGSIKKATKKDNTSYYANIMVIYSNKTEDDGTHIIWGALVDVNNQLQDDNDDDVLININ